VQDMWAIVKKKTWLTSSLNYINTKEKSQMHHLSAEKTCIKQKRMGMEEASNSSPHQLEGQLE
jgi:hypothetical protein